MKHTSGPALKTLVRHSTPAAAILSPAGYFLSMASPKASAPNNLIYCVYAGAFVLATGFVILVGLLRSKDHL
jgi:hypothetical protein